MEKTSLFLYMFPVRRGLQCLQEVMVERTHIWAAGNWGRKKV